MGYPRDLDEYTDEELRAELEGRERLRALALCDYCGRSWETRACRFPDRHAASGLVTGGEVRRAGGSCVG